MKLSDPKTLKQSIALSTPSHLSSRQIKASQNHSSMANWQAGKPLLLNLGNQYHNGLQAKLFQQRPGKKTATPIKLPFTQNAAAHLLS